MSDAQTSMFGLVVEKTIEPAAKPDAKPDAEKVRALRAEAHRRHLVADEMLKKTGDFEAFLGRRLDAQTLTREADALEAL